MMSDASSETHPLTGSHGRERPKSLSWTCKVLVVLTLIVLATTFSWYRWPNQHHRPVGTSSSIPNRRYRATQFISFTINTMGGLASKGECVGRDIDNDYEGQAVCYLGNRQNITEDLLHRFRIVQDALTIVKNDKFADDPEIDHSPDVLKIFMLPEFYLRGPFGAYSTAHIFRDKLLLRLMDDVVDLVQHAEFENYLFVFGTAVMAHGGGHPENQTTQEVWYDDESADEDELLSADQVLYWNFCPVLRGGPNVQKYLVTKRYISTVDFLDRTALPNPGQRSNVSHYDRPSAQLKELLQLRGTELVQDNIIEIDGVRVGLEICLDHRLGVLWESIQSTGQALVDVQLITSAGMAIELGPNPVKPGGGVVYLTDGEASSAACVRTDTTEHFDPETVCRKPGPGGIKHVPVASSGRLSEFITLSGCIDFLNKTSLLEGYYSIYQTQGCANTLKLCKCAPPSELGSFPSAASCWLDSCPHARCCCSHSS
jgi:hypothetical protein